MAAILDMWPGSFEQTCNLLLPECCIWNLIGIGPAVLEEKSFEKVDVADDADDADADADDGDDADDGSLSIL